MGHLSRKNEEKMLVGATCCDVCSFSCGGVTFDSVFSAPCVVFSPFVSVASFVGHRYLTMRKRRESDGVSLETSLSKGVMAIYIYIHLFNVGESVQHVYSCRAQPIKFTTKIYTETSAHKIRLKLKYPSIKSKIKIPNK